MEALEENREGNKKAKKVEKRKPSSSSIDPHFSEKALSFDS